jgi:hypothetical protein
MMEPLMKNRMNVAFNFKQGTSPLLTATWRLRGRYSSLVDICSRCNDSLSRLAGLHDQQRKDRNESKQELKSISL